MSTLFDKAFCLARSSKELAAVATTIWLLTYDRSSKDETEDQIELDVLIVLFNYEANFAEFEKRPRSVGRILALLQRQSDKLDSILAGFVQWTEAPEPFKARIRASLVMKLQAACAAPELKSIIGQPSA